MKSKPVVLWQKEKGFSSNDTTYVAEDLVCERVKKKEQEEENVNPSVNVGGIHRWRTRPLGEVRDNQGGQEKLQLPELLPKLVEAVASKKPLKNNHLYSIEIEERSENVASREVQVNRTNKWVFVNKESYYLLEDQDTNLPQIGGEAAKVTHKEKDKEIEAKLRLASSRHQHKARKEICKGTVKIPLSFETAKDPKEGVYRSRQVLQQNRDSIRKILESRIVASSIPTRSKEFDVTSLKISNPTFVVSCRKGNSSSRWNTTSSGRVPQHSASHPSGFASSQAKYATASCCELDSSQDIDDCIIDNFYQQTKKPQETSSAVSEEFKRNSDETDVSTTTTHGDKDGVYTILTSRPTSSMSTPSLPDTEGLNSRCELNKKEREKSNCLKVFESERSRTNLSTFQTGVRSQSRSGIRAPFTRPTWPSLIDIQRLKSGGFKYRLSAANCNEAREMNKKQEGGENDVSCVPAVEKKTSGLKRMGIIIVPSHTTVDCPLCNLYAGEPTDRHDKSITVYQRPNHPKGTGFGKQNSLLTKATTVSRKSVSSSNTKSRLTATVINKTTSKPVTIVKYRSSKTSEKKRPVSGNENKVGRNHTKNNAQIPIAAIYDQEEPCKFSYVKAPSNLNDE